MKIEFYKHNIGREEIKRIKTVLESLFLTTGKEVSEFEEKFSYYLGCRYAIGVMSCTSALQLSLLANNIGRGDEVITTPLTFIATPNSILHMGAKPVFVDVERNTGNIDADLIENAITSRTKAIIPVHLYGQMCDMRKIKKIANKYSLKIIEDCAHCIEGERDGIRPGQLSDTACFSFYATKNIASGEGGAIVTNNRKIANKLRQLRLHGMTKGAEERYKIGEYQHWDMNLLGYKANMDNIKAALLLNQIDHLDNYWQRRKEIYNIYKACFKKIKEIKLPQIIGKSALHLFTIWVDHTRRDDMLHLLQKKGIGVAVNYRAIHNLTFYKNTFKFKSSDFPNADHIGNSNISLPFYPKLKDKEVKYIEKVFQNILKIK